MKIVDFGFYLVNCLDFDFSGIVFGVVSNDGMIKMIEVVIG